VDNIIGSRIKERRLSINKTQEELGLLVHVKKQTISKWEKGINIPDADTLRELSNITGCTVDYLVGKVDIPNNIIIDCDEGKMDIDKTAYNNLSPEEFQTMMKFLKDARYDIDGLIEDIKNNRIK